MVAPIPPPAAAPRPTPTSSSSVPGPPGPLPPPTWPARASTCCCSRSPASPAPKVCGDGFTPRGIKQIIDLGIDCSEENGWLHNRGLRVLGGGVSLELEWPTLASASPTTAPSGRGRTSTSCSSATPRSPARGCTRTPPSPTPSGRAHRPGRRRHRPRRPRQGQAAGQLPRPAHPGLRRRVGAARAQHRASTKRDDRPMGVAVRRYYRSPRTNDDYLESHLELWDRSDPANPKLLPGYGWIFGMGDGTSNVGLGILSTSRAYGSTDYRALLRSWLDGTPEEWGFREENAEGSGRRRRAADGLQPHPALPPRDAAGRRRGRHGQPVQRRGHRLRHGVGAPSRRGARSSRWPAAARPRRRRWRATRRSCGRRSAATTASATSSPG